jgi:YVTN family beta-propeller protein
VAAAIALVLSLTLVGQATGATVSSAWQAKIGSGGANGSATVSLYSSGTGSISLKVVKMRPSTSLAVVIAKGSCSGSTLLSLPALKTSTGGAASRTSSLTSSQATAIKNATRGTGKIAIKVGSSSTGGVKCGVFDPGAVTPFIAANITVGLFPAGVVIAPNGVWVTNSVDQSLSRIDPAANSVLQTIPLALTGFNLPGAIAYGEGSLWVAVEQYDTGGNSLAGSLLRVDPATGALLATISLGRYPYDVTTSPGAVWVPLADDNQVVRIDTATNAVTATIPVTGTPSGVAYGFGSLWVSTWAGPVVRIDPATNQPTATIQTQDSGGAIAVGPTAVWETNVGHELITAPDGRVTRIDPATNSVVGSALVGDNPQSVAAFGSSVWVGLVDDNAVVQISASTNAVQSRLTLTNWVLDVAATDHAVWAVQVPPSPTGGFQPTDGTLTRIGY